MCSSDLLDILEAPNRNATSTAIRITGVQAFTYESSVADSEANAGSVRLRKRLAKGFAIGGIYTFSKALDDASSIGAGATSGSNTPGLGAGGTGASGGGGGGGSSGASDGSSAGASSGGGWSGVAVRTHHLHLLHQLRPLAVPHQVVLLRTADVMPIN